MQPVSLKSVREKKSLSSNMKLFFQLLAFTRGIKAVGRLLPQLGVTAANAPVSGLGVSALANASFLLVINM